ncbi:hypothetical protein BDD12DRAFT_704509, partial [Trichophaea hybrida]
DWCCSIQGRIPAGVTIVPLICSSDETHLTIFSIDNKCWCIYLTLGNIRFTFQPVPSTR